jgi:hypothetical protein
VIEQRRNFGVKKFAVIGMLLMGLLISPLFASHESNEAALRAIAQRNIQAYIQTAIASKDVTSVAQSLENLVQQRSSDLIKNMDKHLVDFVNGIDGALLKQVLNGFTLSVADPLNNKKFYFKFQHIQDALDAILDKIQNTEKKLTVIELLEYPAPYPKSCAFYKKYFLRELSLPEKYSKKRAAVEKKLQEEKKEKNKQARNDALKYFEKALRRKPTEVEQNWVLDLFKIERPLSTDSNPEYSCCML